MADQSAVGVLPESELPGQLEQTEKQKVDYADLARRFVASPAFIPGVIMALGLGVLFFTVIRRLLTLWDSPDGYYSHGYLVPFISGYIVYRWWPKLSQIPVRPYYPAAILIVFLLACTWLANTLTIVLGLSLLLPITMIACAWYLAGFRWALSLTPPILYLLFALPIWEWLFIRFTTPLQLISTSMSVQLLKAFGLNPQTFPGDPTTVFLDYFTLNVAVPCSGMKLLVALLAFTVFFLLIAKLKWWGNLIMTFMILPLAIFINGLRIALIGVVGNSYGAEAGTKFHDYSGYITLIVCFFILFKFARALGWKD